jgi:hypothetical protein
MIVRALHEIARTGALDPRLDADWAARTTTGSRRASCYQRQMHIEALLSCVTPLVARAAEELVALVDGGDLLDVNWMDHTPVMRPLRADPRWSDLRARVEARARPIREALTAP